MTKMTHEEAYAELAAVALGAVPAELEEALREHASVCPECGPELAALEETVATLGESAPRYEMNRGRSAGIRSRLVMRGRAEREAAGRPMLGPPDLNRGVASITTRSRETPGPQRVVESGTSRHLKAPPDAASGAPSRDARRRSVPAWLAIAATIALVATGAQLLRVTAERDRMKSQVVSGRQGEGDLDSLAAAVAEKDAMIQAMAGPDVKVVTLLSDSAKQPLGRMFWNRASDEWTMVTYGLRPPRPGRTYQVWLVTDAQKISAGTFRPDAAGRIVMRAKYALDREALRAVAVTEEPEGGVPEPTGPMVVVGTS